MAKTPPIERALFREGPDRSIVFFPWGLSQRGYRLPDEAAKRKATRAVSLVFGCTMAIGTWTAYRLQPLVEPDGPGASGLLGVLAVPVLLIAATMLGYWLRVSRLIEGAQASDLQISREAQLREAAELVNPREIALAGAALAVLSAVTIFIAPYGWWIGALGVGLGLLVMAWAWVILRASRS